MTEAEVKSYLMELQPLVQLSTDQRNDVKNLLLHPGMYSLLGIVLAEQNGFMAQLVNARAGDAEQVRALGVIQGKVAGVDRLRHIILECVSVPTDTEEV
jgi:hypothetical protein